MNINAEDYERVTVSFDKGVEYSLSLTGKGKIFYERHFNKGRAKIVPQVAQNIIAIILSKGVLSMKDEYRVDWSELGFIVDTPNYYTLGVKFQGVIKNVGYQVWDGYYPIELKEIVAMMDELYQLAENQQSSMGADSSQ